MELQVWVVRKPDLPPASVARAYETLKSLELARYARGCFLEHAPKFVDCFTALRYFFTKVYDVDVPAYNIGDMPRMLAKVHSWKVLKVSRNQLQDGDLIFAQSHQSSRRISHVAWYYGGLFHHVSRKRTMAEQTLEEFACDYKQAFEDEEGNPTPLLSFIDSRNCFARALYGGELIREMREGERERMWLWPRTRAMDGG